VFASESVNTYLVSEMEVKSILSEEGKQLRVVNNFKFCVARKLNDDEIPWGCVNKKSNCLAKV
jgi:hypothetical protein